MEALLEKVEGIFGDEEITRLMIALFDPGPDLFHRREDPACIVWEYIGRWIIPVQPHHPLVMGEAERVLPQISHGAFNLRMTQQ